MSLKKELKQDIHQFFRETEKMPPAEKRKTLELLMDKYIHLSRAETLFNKDDFNMIIQKARQSFIDRDFDKKFKDDFLPLHNREMPNLCLIEATISHLAQKDCLKRTPKFEYE